MTVSHSIPIHASLLFSYFKDHFSLCHVKAKHSFLLTYLTLTLCSTIDFVYMVNARQRSSIVPEPIDKSPYISPRGENIATLQEPNLRHLRVQLLRLQAFLLKDMVVHLLYLPLNNNNDNHNNAFRANF